MPRVRNEWFFSAKHRKQGLWKTRSHWVKVSPGQEATSPCDRAEKIFCLTWWMEALREPVMSLNTQLGPWAVSDVILPRLCQTTGHHRGKRLRDKLIEQSLSKVYLKDAQKSSCSVNLCFGRNFPCRVIYRTSCLYSLQVRVTTWDRE